MPKPYRAIWSPRASDDLKEIVEYIAQDSPKAAREVAQKIVTRIVDACTFPQSGKQAPNFDKNHKLLLVDSYSVMYRIDNQRQAIRIQAIVHQARLWPPKNL